MPSNAYMAADRWGRVISKELSEMVLLVRTGFCIHYALITAKVNHFDLIMLSRVSNDNNYALICIVLFRGIFGNRLSSPRLILYY